MVAGGTTAILVLVAVALFMTRASRATETVTPTEPGNVLLTQLRDKAEAGDRDSQLQLGQMYLNGDGVAANTDQAVRWLQEAAKHNDPVAQTTLGVIYKEGRGTRADPDIAARWFDKAAHRGYADAQFQLAGMLRSGSGVRRNLSRAYVWYFLAARNGYTAAKSARDAIMPSLSMAEVTEAENMALTWQPGDDTAIVTDFAVAGETIATQ